VRRKSGLDMARNIKIPDPRMKRKAQQDATITCLLLTCLNMFRASLCPSLREQRPCYCIWCVVLVLLDVVGGGCGALSCRMRAVERQYEDRKINKMQQLDVYYYYDLVGCEHYEGFCSVEQKPS